MRSRKRVSLSAKEIYLSDINVTVPVPLSVIAEGTTTTEVFSTGTVVKMPNGFMIVYFIGSTNYAANQDDYPGVFHSNRIDLIFPESFLGRTETVMGICKNDGDAFMWVGEDFTEDHYDVLFGERTVAVALRLYSNTNATEAQVGYVATGFWK